jgi:hypothetical protein
MKDWQVTLAQQAKIFPTQTAGVYLLFVGKNLDYVGQSDDVRRRLTNEHHVYDASVHDLVVLIHAPVYDDRLALERYFNQKYNPPNSYVGSAKQTGDFDERYLQLSAAERRSMWQGPPFDEFALPDLNELNAGSLQIVLQSGKISQNIFQAPSVLTLPPEELLGF